MSYYNLVFIFNILSTKYIIRIFIFITKLSTFYIFFTNDNNIYMIIIYSLNINSNNLSLKFLCIIIILECIFGIIMSIKLILISINFMQTEYLITSHDKFTMKTLFLCSISSLSVFISIFLISINIYNKNNYNILYKSYLCDITRIIQLLFEIIFIFLSIILFFYICPSQKYIHNIIK